MIKPNFIKTDNHEEAKKWCENICGITPYINPDKRLNAMSCDINTHKDEVYIVAHYTKVGQTIHGSLDEDIRKYSWNTKQLIEPEILWYDFQDKLFEGGKWLWYEIDIVGVIESFVCNHGREIKVISYVLIFVRVGNSLVNYSDKIFREVGIMERIFLCLTGIIGFSLGLFILESGISIYKITFGSLLTILGLILFWISFDIQEEDWVEVYKKNSRGNRE